MSLVQAVDPVARLAEARARLKAATAEAGAERDVEIVAVTKTHGPEAIRPLLRAGHRVFGENRVQEAEAKWPALKAEYPDVVLHLIGPLQTNKVREAVALFDVIETLDRPRLADALMRQERRPTVFVQVNTGEEPQKAGAPPLEAEAFVEACRARGLAPAGLMCIPPVDADPAPHFALLATIARRSGLKGLSMGMSGDYEIAAQLGASHVRLGSALFGPRG